MKCLLRHSILRLIPLLCLLLVPTACHEATGLADEPPAGEGTVTLVLNTDVVGSTRAGATGDWPNEEKMKTLRIVVLHPGGTVEHNGLIDFGTAPQTQYTQFIKVIPNETKTIYLIANEESVDGLKSKLDAFTEGTPGFANAADAFSFALTAGNAFPTPIPLSSKYEVEIKEQNESYQFYLVRAATKFSFRFRNLRSKPVTVNSIQLSSIADRMYLMPHKQTPIMDFAEADGTTSPLFWIDWLQRVAEESQANPDNPINTALAEKRGWIQDYDIPTEATHSPVTVSPSLEVPAPATTATGVQTPGTASYPDFYLPESQKLKDPNNKYGEQAYTMTFKLTDDGKTQIFPDIPFNNLKALFRNTHVVVEVTFNQIIEVNIQYTVCPWLEYKINIPKFD